MYYDVALAAQLLHARNTILTPYYEIVKRAQHISLYIHQHIDKVLHQRYNYNSDTNWKEDK